MTVCITRLLASNEKDAAPFLFSFAKALGNVPFWPATWGISAQIIVQASQLTKIEIRTPALINHSPQSPVRCFITPALDGLGITLSCCCDMMPKGRMENSKQITKAKTKPIKVARPISFLLRARPESADRKSVV